MPLAGKCLQTEVGAWLLAFVGASLLAMAGDPRAISRMQAPADKRNHRLQTWDPPSRTG